MVRNLSISATKLKLDQERCWVINTLKIFIAALFFISVLAKGSFFGTTSLFLAILIVLALLIRLQKLPPIKVSFLLFALSIVYLTSTLFNYLSFENMIFTLRPLICLLFLTLVFNVEDKQYLGKVVICSGVVVAGIGLLAFSGLFNFAGMITANRLQGTFQYANAMGVFLAACALLTRSEEYAKDKNRIIILETSLFLTQSVGAVAMYFFCLVLGLLFQSKDLRTKFYSETIMRIFASSLFAVLLYSSVN